MPNSQARTTTSRSQPVVADERLEEAHYEDVRKEDGVLDNAAFTAFETTASPTDVSEAPVICKDGVVEDSIPC